MNRLPNIVTGARLALALFTFFGLAAVPLLGSHLDEGQQYALERWAFAAFVIAALTDFVDGWLARRLGAVSVWGAILDPIADKVLVCGVILGPALDRLQPHGGPARRPDPVPRVHRQRAS